MIYNVKISLDYKLIHKKYYSVLGIILNLFNIEEKIYKESIISVSNIYNSNVNEISFISLSIYGKNEFYFILNKLLSTEYLNIDGKNIRLLSVDYDILYFSDNNNFNNYNSLNIKFKTPTIIKKEINGIDINQLLPVPEIFLLSSIRKYNLLYNKNFDLVEIKRKLKENIIVVSFDISTKLVKIKGNNKAGVIGKVKYELLNGLDLEIKIILYNALNLSKIVGIGTGNRLGLGQVGVYFSN